MTDHDWEHCRECGAPSSLVLVSLGGGTVFGSCGRHLNRLVTWWLEDDPRVEVYTVASWQAACRWAAMFPARRRRKRVTTGA